MRSMLLRSMLGGYALSALLGIACIFASFSGPFAMLLWSSLVVSGVLTIVLLAGSLHHVGHPMLRIPMGVSSVAAVVSGGLLLVMIWVGTGMDDSVGRWLGMILLGSLALSLSCLHLGYVFYWRFTGRVLRILCFGLLAVNLFLLSQIESAIFFDELVEAIGSALGPDVYAQLIGALVVLFVCGNLSLPVANLVVRGRHSHLDQTGLSVRIEIPIDCPRCGHRCEMRVGDSTCPQCKLGMHLRLDEPRCRCGYLVYRCEAADCPECGRHIPDYLRWTPLSPSS